MLLITGSTGHSGEWFIKMLIAQHYQKKIRCTIRSGSNITLLKNSGLDIEFMKGNLKDPLFVNLALENVSTVINFTGLKCVNNIVNSEKSIDLDWIISVHTTAIFSKYKALSKEYIDIENQLVESGIQFTIVRPTMIYGSKKDRNISKLIKYIKANRFFPVFGNGRNLMQPIYAKDVASAVYSIFINQQRVINKSYNIAGKYPVTYNEMLKLIAKNLNRKVVLIHIPFSISLILIRILNSINKKFPISIEQVMRINEDKVFDYSKAVKDFDFSPISFDLGLLKEIKDNDQKI